MVPRLIGIAVLFALMSIATPHFNASGDEMHRLLSASAGVTRWGQELMEGLFITGESLVKFAEADDDGCIALRFRLCPCGTLLLWIWKMCPMTLLELRSVSCLDVVLR